MGSFTGQRLDPFRISGERFQEKWLLQRFMRHKKAMRHFNWLKDEAFPTGPWEDGEGYMRPIGGNRSDAFRHALRSRYFGAIGTALFLVLPMWTLALGQNIYVELVSATAWIFAFGTLTALFVSTLEAVFAATLSYAAVLMVFVGVVMQRLSDDE